MDPDLEGLATINPVTDEAAEAWVTSTAGDGTWVRVLAEIQNEDHGRSRSRTTGLWRRPVAVVLTAATLVVAAFVLPLSLLRSTDEPPPATSELPGSSSVRDATTSGSPSTVPGTPPADGFGTTGTIAPSWIVPDVGVVGTTRGNGGDVVRRHGSVFAAGGNRETVTALDAVIGSELWTSQIPGAGAVRLLHVNASSVVVGGYEVVVGLNPADGVELWRIELGTGLWPALAVPSARGLHIVVDRPTTGDAAPPEVVTIDAGPGSILWRAALPTVGPGDVDLQWHESVVAGDQLLVLTTAALHSLDIESGDLRWTVPFEQEAIEGHAHQTVQVLGATAYVADTGGEIVAVDLTTGAEQWRVDGGDIAIGLALSPDDALAYWDGSEVVAVSAETGERMWAVPGGENVTLAEGTDRVYVFTPGQVRALGANGDPLWTTPVAVDVPVQVVGAGDVVIASGADGVAIVAATDGRLLASIGPGVAEPPLVLRRAIVLAHNDGSVGWYDIGVVDSTIWTSGDGSPEPFVPPTEVDGDAQQLVLVFPDGSSVAATWPAELDLFGGGLRPTTWVASIGQPGAFSAELIIRRGRVEDVVALFGDAELLGEHDTPAGPPAGHWRATDGRTTYQFLTFQFEDWAVLVQGDGLSVPPRSARERWAAGLQGRTSDAGFLILESDDLLVAGVAEAGPRLELFSTNGRVQLQPASCEPGFIARINPNRDLASWCTANGDLVVTVRGAALFAQQVFDGLELGPVRTPG